MVAVGYFEIEPPIAAVMHLPKPNFGVLALVAFGIAYRKPRGILERVKITGLQGFLRLL